MALLAFRYSNHKFPIAFPSFHNITRSERNEDVQNERQEERRGIKLFTLLDYSSKKRACPFFFIKIYSSVRKDGSSNFSSEVMKKFRYLSWFAARTPLRVTRSMRLKLSQIPRVLRAKKDRIG